MHISKTIVVLSIFAITAAAAIPCFAGSCVVLTPTSCVGGVCNAVFSNSDSTVAATWNLITAFQASCAPTGMGTIPPTSAPPNTLAVVGQATLGATNPICSWTCSNPYNASPAVIQFDLADGLPVELMGFSVE